MAPIGCEHRLNALPARLGLLLLILFSALILSPPLPLMAAEALVLRDGFETYQLRGNSLDILEDPSGRLGIDDVVTPGISRRFQPNRQDIPNYGLTASAFWLRFSIDDRSATGEQWLLMLDLPHMDLADLYLPRPDGSFQVRRSGDMRAMSVRDLPNRNIIFSLSGAPGAATYYLRTRTAGRVQFPLTIYSRAAFRKTESVQQYVFGAYSGFMATLAVIGISLFILLRDRNYLYFVIYICTSMLVQWSFFGYLYAWAFPSRPVVNDDATIMLSIAIILAGLAFARTFLNAGQYAPRHDRLIKLLMCLNLALIPLWYLAPPLITKKLLHFDLLIFMLLTVTASIVCYREGNVPALKFLYSRLMVYAGGLVFVLASFKLLPADFLTRYILLITSVLEATFVTVALADRFKMMNRQITGLTADLQREVAQRSAANRCLEEQIAQRLRLEHEVALISDNERIRLGYDLHDGLCQQLTGALLRCSVIERDMAEAGRDTGAARALGTLLEETIRDAYAIAKGLYPVDLDPKSLIPALDRLASQTAVKSQIFCGFTHDQNLHIDDPERALHIYRIAQEAVANASRHAGASHIGMALHETDGKLRLCIEDDGRGMAEEATAGTGGMGLRIMSYRARMIGGDLVFEEPAAGGTRVVCTTTIS